MPALLTSTSTGPSWAAIACTIVATAALSDTSAPTAMARRPAARIGFGHGARLVRAFAIVHRDIGAGFGECQRDGTADAARPAGDQGDTVGQVRNYGHASISSHSATIEAGVRNNLVVQRGVLLSSNKAVALTIRQQTRVAPCRRLRQPAKGLTVDAMATPAPRVMAGLDVQFGIKRGHDARRSEAAAPCPLSAARPAGPAGSRGTPRRASNCAAPPDRRRTRPPSGAFSSGSTRTRSCVSGVMKSGTAPMPSPERIASSTACGLFTSSNARRGLPGRRPASASQLMSRHRRVVVAEQDQPVRVEVLGALRHAVLLQVFGRGADLPLDRHQVALHQVGLLRRVHADRHVGLAHRQVEVGSRPAAA